MPFSAGVVQEAGVPLRPSISTRQSRQEPNASKESVAQSFGIGACSVAAAAITDVPLGTLTCRPSIVSVTCSSATRIGVPVSSSERNAMRRLLFRGLSDDRPLEIFGEMIERAEYGVGRQPAERAKR